MSGSPDESHAAAGAATKVAPVTHPGGKDQESGGRAKKPRAEVVADRFKTKLCTKWLETGRCPYDSRCMFAHGENELRTTAMNLRDGLTTEESIWRFKKTGVLGAVQHRSRSQPGNDNRHPHAAKPTSAVAHVAVGAPGLHHGSHPSLMHVPHIAMPGLVPLTPHYMPYLTPQPHAHLANAGVAHPQHVGPMLSLFPPMHPFAYASAPASPMVYLVDPGTSAFSSAFGVGVPHRVDGQGSDVSLQ